MKKLISLALILLLTLSLVACGEPEPTDTISSGEPALSGTVSDTVTTDTNSDADTETAITDTEVSTDSQPASVTTEEEPPVEYETLTIQIHETTIPSAYESRIRTKTLSDKWTEGLIEKLLQAPETGVTVEKFSDQEIPKIYFEDFAERLDVVDQKGEVTWFIARDVMFRYVRKGTTKLLCKVETHLGEGKEVELSDELKELLKIAIEYAPKNTYLGTWKNGTLEVKNVLPQKDSIEISIEEITKTNSSSRYDYKVKYTLLSKKNETVKITLFSGKGDDTWLSMDLNQRAELKAGEKKTLEWEFYGKEDLMRFALEISVDNSYLNVVIDPK